MLLGMGYGGSVGEGKEGGFGGVGGGIVAGSCGCF